MTDRKPRQIVLLKKEQKFIARLEKLLDKCPNTLSLFGWSGSLHILKDDKTGHPCTVAHNFSVMCDGGDPTEVEVSQNVEIDYR